MQRTTDRQTPGENCLFVFSFQETAWVPNFINHLSGSETRLEKKIHLLSLTKCIVQTGYLFFRYVSKILDHMTSHI